MVNTIQKYPLATLFSVIVLMLLIHLNVPNITIMEARNFITAREMIDNGNWILTTMNGEPRYQKPPLPTWFTAISALIFGVKSLFALRLPAALMVFVLGIAAYFLSLKLKLSKVQALNNGLILTTSFYVFAIINEAPWDIYAHAFMLSGLYFLFLIFEKENNKWKNTLFAGILIGCSILSKGPVSLFALFLPFIISYGIVFKFKKTKIVPFLASIILFLIVGAWWFAYVRYADPEAFLKIATKETGNWSSYNVRPFYYYWSFFTQSGLWTIPAFIGLLYPYLVKRVKNTKAYKFTFWWTILAVVLLSAIPEKKARYLMPVLIPLALNTGFYIQYLIKNFSQLKKKAETIPVYFNFGIISVCALAIPIALYFILKEDLQNYLFNYLATSIAGVLIGVLLLKNLLRKNMLNTFYLTIAFMVSVFLFGLPISKHFNKNKAYNNITSLHTIEEKNNITAYSIGEMAPEFIWNYNGIIKNIYKNEELLIPSEEKFGLLILDEDFENIKTKLNSTYSINLKETYNLNVSKRKRTRLVRNLYIVSKK
ncbi:4-amino-4-deoxy-L-arabinose transferase [Lutibacter oricola]|uniref:4-amino-4-deoxy-L-arabinose transferase n=1 Tax=Lutibacter oricola TaxID=762486 RepID=A0A1H3F1S4_9FLAO|nr:glycosyltransferase family 39 protein [Lutibacter oricola]SDX84951.1 4-amino-4-deoxy-L-arabinose transferase [Lutibacter oricola]